MIGGARGRSAAILVVGDLVTYIFSLIVTLTIRYEAVPSRNLVAVHMPAFLILFILFVVINFSAGLYDKQASLVRGKIYGPLLRAQIVNAFFGAAFFYFAPVAIAPKANLFIFFVLCSVFLLVWRSAMYPVISVKRKQNAILLGSGPDMNSLYEEIDENIRYGISFKERLYPKGDVAETVADVERVVKKNNASVIVADLHDSTVEGGMSFLYSLIFSGIQIIDGSKLYESVFDRIPLSLLGERWFVENSSSSLGNRRVYDTLKRIIDIACAGVAGIISLVFYPFVYVAIKMDDKGPVFTYQDRIGKNGKVIRIVKFRTMTGQDHGKYDPESGGSRLKVTRVGELLRKTRIDEFPQLWNVIKGDQSLIGPRPELPSLVAIYEKEIPYYNARHLVKPGLSGWAQIYHEAHPHHAVATKETKDKLSYDLYYIKNRSLALDIKITLRTFQVMLKKVGARDSREKKADPASSGRRIA